MRPLIIGIDASRNRSGGARHHLVGLLSAGEPAALGIGAVHVWAYRELLEALPDAAWLVKHSPQALERSLLSQMYWQRYALPIELRRAGCDILLSTDAGTVANAEPSVVMSRDMLSYEPGEMGRYGLSKSWLRLLALRYVQARSLRRARGAIFLTQYAADVIRRFSGALRNVAIIPHGIDDSFRNVARSGPQRDFRVEAIRCVYVSNAELYKHQWHVIEAIADLRQRGRRITLTLAGGGSGPAQRRIDEAVARFDPRHEYVEQLGALAHNELPSLLARSDVFIFASSCENMPNTLLEGMASGLPIACSKRGPMPEVLGDGGVYFDPEEPASIACAVDAVLVDPELRGSLSQSAALTAERYSWSRCARETWSFLAATARSA